MTDYYSKLNESDNRGDQLLSRISKIMAGQYCANLQDIKEGKFEEDITQTRIWKWEDRLEAISKIYAQNKDVLSDVNNGLIDRLKEILHSNRYLKRKHADKLKKINELFR